MNSVHDSTKDWQQQPAASDASMHYPPMDHQHHGYPSMGAPVHPPLHQHHPHYATATHGYQPKPETDMRLPGRPSPAKNETASPVTRTLPPSSSSTPPPPPPLSAPGMPSPSYRKRSRSDSLFPQETGPFFSSAKPFDNLFALDRTSLLTVRIHSKMDRGFFLADNDWTCYRRNYFQVSSAFSIHGINHYYADHEPPCLVRSQDGLFYPVRRFLLGISARVSNSDKRIELVQHTPKRDKGPQMTPQPKPIIPGGNLSMSAVGTNQNIVTFERIQFKTATANNGKRRAAQQYYVCVVELYAETDQGEQIKVASCQSAPLVVRGRSPGHYTDSHQERAAAAAAISAPAPTSVASAMASPQQDRFFSSQRAAPYTPPPSTVMGEYGHYPYYPPHPYMPTMMMPPTSSPAAPPQTATSAPPPPPPQANYHNPGPYMVAGMPVSSPQPSPHYPTAPEFAAPPPPPPHHHNHHHHQQQQQQHPMATPDEHPKLSPNGYNMEPDWSRSRINSAGSMPQSYFSAQGTPTLSSNASQASAFSPTTPTTPYVATSSAAANGGARKYNAVNNICNQQTS
ncbi:hypothetical protein O0I10_001874 [Lichtheimia ornata]|uniref:NDT80 domain-containing protein n=1 Tax=Lichtheimia ornata TaxID=688661 RepID=A0AAD7Y1Y6_9FUNG|nr:uncharacterized protein O0I10_001874 [Lichtheimia ornata]KAJ8662181.1 hypothetical protein O0I10_001874 [Lichtheimia ornata]